MTVDVIKTNTHRRLETLFSFTMETRETEEKKEATMNLLFQLTQQPQNPFWDSP